MTANSNKVKNSLSLLRLNRIRLVIVLVVILALTQLYVSNSFVTDGEKIKEADTQTRLLQSENMKLKNQIEDLGSLSYIQKQAIGLGFIKIDKVQYLNQPVVVASR